MRAIGYTRVSTIEQAENGGGLDAQRAAIEAGCRLRGWEIVDVLVDPGVSGGAFWHERPALVHAVELLEGKLADVLVVAKLDRLTRSTLDFSTLLDRSRRKGWSVLCLDLGVDTTTPTGELVANVIAAFAQFERRLVSLRTKEALAAKRASGVRLGRPSAVPVEVRERILQERAAGLPLRAIARGLNEDEVGTPAGGKHWTHSSVANVLNGQETRELVS